MRFAQATVVLFCVLSLTACSPREPKQTVTVGGDSDILQTDTIMKGLPSGNYEHPSHGDEEWFAYGAITGKTGTPANGVVQAHRYEDGMYVLEMQINVQRAGEGRFYQAWLVDDAGTWEPAGRPRSHFGDARHQLNFETDKDLRSFQRAVVTLELDDGNPDPGLVVAEGELKVRER